jgi:quercetin dioxygenase-like cupin family protein
MPVVDIAGVPEIAMRAGMKGKWLVSRERGASEVSVLSNIVEPGNAAPLHMHAYEEVIFVEAGEIWVDMEGTRATAAAGQVVIIPPGAPHAWGATGATAARLLFIWPGLDPFAPDKSRYLDGEPPAVR